jgi:hypothetical protein
LNKIKKRRDNAMSLKQFPLIGKKRVFKNIKMFMLMDFQDKLKEIMKSDKSTKEKYLEIGKHLKEFMDPFDAKEMLEIEPDEYNLIQQLNMIYTLCKSKRTEAEIEEYLDKIKMASIDGQLSFMSNPATFQGD